jgi:hypothetical protein
LLRGHPLAEPFGISLKIAPFSADNNQKQHFALKSRDRTMHRSALFLLTLHLAAAPVLAQTPPMPSAQTITPPVSETLVNFDPQHAEVTWSQNHWQLVADGQLLKDFGRREIEARVAMRLVRDLHLTQHGVIGSPGPVMEYWLSNGRAPHGLAAGLHLMPLDAPLLRVEQTQGQWTVRDNHRVLFAFGSQESDARNALAIIHKYGFTQLGFIGEAGPSMLVMLGHADADTSDPNMPHLEHKSPLHDASSDSHAPKPSTYKLTASDTNPLVSPVIPPLRTATETRKDTVNAFGRKETIEVLPISEKMKLERKPPPAPLAMEWIDRTTFDWRQVQLRQEGGQYIVAAGSLVLGRFHNDRDARMAQSAVQHYRFTEWNHIGRPQSFCSYFLCSGEAPRGQYLGVQAEAIPLDKLSVAQVENRWAIMAGEKPLVWFGSRPEEARVMLNVIQREQFDRLCHIGDDHGLTFFVRSR